MSQSCNMGQEGMLRIFHPKKLTASAGFKSANLGTRGQHPNHYTTEAAFKAT
jgi:hypothetical protein